MLQKSFMITFTRLVSCEGKIKCIACSEMRRNNSEQVLIKQASALESMRVLPLDA